MLVPQHGQLPGAFLPASCGGLVAKFAKQGEFFISPEGSKLFCKHAQPRHVSLVGRKAAEAPTQKGLLGEY